MSLPTRPFGRSMLPDFRDLFDMLPSLSSLRPAMDIHSIRIEDKLEGDTYIIRAELPGINVDEDLDISVQNNLLTIEAQRSEEQTETGRSEFRYGSFVRTGALPEGAQEDSIDASYEDGILTIRVKLSKPRREGPADPGATRLTSHGRVEMPFTHRPLGPVRSVSPSDLGGSAQRARHTPSAVPSGLSFPFTPFSFAFPRSR